MLECPDGRQPTALVGFGVISLKEGCTITSREFHYPHTFRGIVEISISSGSFNKEVIYYIVQTFQRKMQVNWNYF